MGEEGEELALGVGLAHGVGVLGTVLQVHEPVVSLVAGVGVVVVVVVGDSLVSDKERHVVVGVDVEGVLDRVGDGGAVLEHRVLAAVTGSGIGVIRRVADPVVEGDVAVDTGPGGELEVLHRLDLHEEVAVGAVAVVTVGVVLHVVLGDGTAVSEPLLGNFAVLVYSGVEREEEEGQTASGGVGGAS